MKHPYLLLMVLYLSTPVFAQKKIKTWPVARTLIGMSVAEAEKTIRDNGFRRTKDSESNGMRSEQFEDRSVQLVHPILNEMNDLFVVGSQNGKVALILFFLCEDGSGEEDLGAAYAGFEKDLMADGFRLTGVNNKEAPIAVTRYFHSSTLGLKVKTEVFRQEGFVLGVNISICREEIRMDQK